jgi:hypothetical protein
MPSVARRCGKLHFEKMPKRNTNQKCLPGRGFFSPVRTPRTTRVTRKREHDQMATRRAARLVSRWGRDSRAAGSALSALSAISAVNAPVQPAAGADRKTDRRDRQPERSGGNPPRGPGPETQYAIIPCDSRHYGDLLTRSVGELGPASRELGPRLANRPGFRPYHPGVQCGPQARRPARNLTIRPIEPGG